jgi:hypothetical protein
LLALLTCCSVDKPEEIQEAELHIPQKIDFNLHVKPILSDRCYACHGPDNNSRKANLRLDTEEGAFAKIGEEKDHHAIVAGNLNKSSVYHRLVTSDPNQMMPPPESNLTLSNEEKAILIRWIEQGAEWKDHWSFIKPEKARLPKVKNGDWVRNEIDQFVLAKLESADLAPTEEADRRTWLRRASFDLTGLPPNQAHIEAFLTDDTEQAYDHAVDRMLQSDACAERLTMDWMDVARYADSHGYHADGYRYMWPWRDWVIEAFRRNMPYDQFLLWQIAGDLLPNANKETILATAFNRNHPMTAEGGIIDEEYRMEYVFDRANTTSRAFLGLTLECAQCHDHKYDPLSQKDFFALTAFYNNLDEIGMTGDDGNTGPLMLLPEKEAEQKLQFLQQTIAEQEQMLAHRQQMGQTKELAPLPAGQIVKQIGTGLLAHLPLDTQHNGETVNNAAPANKVRVAGKPQLVDGVRGKAVRTAHDFDFLELKEIGQFEMTDPFTVSFWVKPEELDHYQALFGNAGHKNSFWRGYEAYLDSINRVSFRLIHAKPHNVLHIATGAAIPLQAWSHITAVYDGSGLAAGAGLYINGQRADTHILRDNLYKSIRPVGPDYQFDNRALRFGKSYSTFSGDDGIFTGSFDDIRLYNRALTAVEIAGLYKTYDISNGMQANVKPEEWAAYFVQYKDDTAAQIRSRLAQLRRERLQVMSGVEEIMVMKERETPRTTYVLDRGRYDAPTEPVLPATPAVLPDFADSLPGNRLGLARWLIHPDNPLVARVAVNRYWHHLFGRGIVGTVEDFGNQGDLPTHPLLLDWLAVDFVESGWDVRHLLKKIVTSATYRQGSVARKELLEKDPQNLLLARGPRHRLQGEMIRDNALFASGLLVQQVGGPSVRPYQPEGLWIEKGTFSHMLLRYIPDHGDSLYRRSLYTFLKRTSPPPAMEVFDVPNRNTCTVRRQSTSTPLQPLVLMNDPQFMEAARVLAQRIQHVGGQEISRQLQQAFVRCTGRELSQSELQVFESFYKREHDRFLKDGQAARAVLAIGEYPQDPTLDEAHTAALTMVGSLMFNHYEFYTKR